MTKASNSNDVISRLEKTVGSADWSRWTRNRYSYYDYVQYPVAGATQLQFFQVPTGSVDPNNTTIVKTLEQTNMNEARSFGRVNYIIRQIRTHIRLVPLGRQLSGISGLTHALFTQFTPVYNTIRNLLPQGTLVINIGQKEYWDINQPFITAPPGFSIELDQHSSNETVSSVGDMITQQSGKPTDVYQVKPEQLIEAGQTFNVQINFDNATSPVLAQVNSANMQIEVGVIFDGYILRPVQ